ncbi:hypothetical protein [Methylobacterium sp. PvR107]|uniref:hypothetical protein n=1 Tax=Methylobacterium sp. PvR107 TaxID=2806597 RepID=UPI001AEB6E2E|nr:hypothetical protein [Methylobacterium sp. PvR107]MBP1178871.1 hypothetical protein [Methylobacterium sp. PvR107]
MRTYRVTFTMTVPDDTGHDHRAVQSAIVVRARSDVSAAWQAKAILCERAQVVDWRFRADRCEVAALTDVAA